METYGNVLEAEGTLLLSGFLNSDVNEMVEYASNFNLSLQTSYKKNEWAGIQFQKSN
jgi:ribosomal protein L11 methylase PrmA